MGFLKGFKGRFSKFPKIVAASDPSSSSSAVGGGFRMKLKPSRNEPQPRIHSSHRKSIVGKIIHFLKTEQDSDYTWERSYYFYLALIGSNLGIAELFQFIIDCYSNGGIVYFVVYALLCFILGFPLLLTEVAFAQYTGRRQIEVFKSICPIAGGLGYSLLFTLMMFAINNSIVFSYFLNYFFASFSPTLPWTSCGHHWNHQGCYTTDLVELCDRMLKIFWNNTCMTSKEVCESWGLRATNKSHCINQTQKVEIHVNIERLLHANRTNPTADYLEYIIESPLNEGFTSFIAILMYLIGWTIILATIRNGFRSTIKVLHVILGLGFLSLVLLLTAMFLTQQSGINIANGLKPNFTKLQNVQFWLDASSAAMTTLSIGIGTNYLVASYNNFNDNFIMPVALFIVIQLVVMLSFCCIMLGCIGIKPLENISPVSELDIGNTGLRTLLIHVQAAFTGIPVSQLWLLTFFIFCMAILLENTGAVVETLVTSLSDICPGLRVWKLWVRVAVCLVGWLVGVILLTVRHTNFPLLIFTLVEKDLNIIRLLQNVIVTWVYGFATPVKQRHFKDFAEMLGWKAYLFPIIQFTIYISAPIFLLFGFFQGMLSWQLNYRQLHSGVIVFTTIIFLIRTPLILISYAIFKIFKNRKLKLRWKQLVIPEDEFYTFRER